MSYFVLIYDRTKRHLVDLQEFPDNARPEAQQFHLNAQSYALREHLDREVVFFQADSEATLRRTHGSYFLSEEELRDRTRRVAEAS